MNRLPNQFSECGDPDFSIRCGNQGFSLWGPVSPVGFQLAGIRKSLTGFQLAGTHETLTGF